MNDPFVGLALLTAFGCPFDWTCDGNGTVYVWPASGLSGTVKRD